MVNYWLMKSEPDVFGIDHLMKMQNQTEHWDGVRNYQARNMMRDDMKVGDKVFFYHSNTKVPGIVGEMVVAREAYPDFTSWDPESKYYDPKSSEEKPRWFMVDVKFVRKYPRTISLDELKKNPALEDMPLVKKGCRLSIMPLTSQHWETVLEML